ncbi:MAG: phospholipid carrier-dependent glycosyltransferase [Chloroflexi bacterium]|nr:phospholipid carrier-dependent glycosyltransferase [Chloroflexota bacterium]
MRKLAPVIIIVFVYLVVGSLYAVKTPDWQAPDEPAHYNYIRQLANGRLPIMELGDYDEEYRSEIVSSRFAPQYDIAPLTYEDWQPPLYYLLQTPIYLLTGGSLTALRLFSVLLGVGVVILAFGIARLLFPAQEWVAWTTAVFVAFLPQHLAILASTNNDALAELLIAALLILLIKWSQQPRTADSATLPLSIGVLLGLGFLTKGTVYLMTAVVAVVLLWRCWGQWGKLIHNGLRIFVPAFLLGALWWGRNSLLYGGLDILGKTRHDSVVIGQIRTAQWIAEYGLAETGRRFAQTSFNSFWGQFGWMALPMLNPPWLYPLLWLLTGTAASGLILAFFIWPKNKDTSRKTSLLTLALIIPVFLFGLTAALHIGYNLTFVQHQGRYLFPALIPIGLGMAVGLGAWGLLLTRPLASRFPSLLYLLPLSLGLALVAIDIYMLFRFIVPELSA